MGAACIDADVDETDDAIIRGDIEGRLDGFIVRGFACAPKGTEALSESHKHATVSRTAGGDELLDHWNLRGPVASRRDHDDEGARSAFSLSRASTSSPATGFRRAKLSARISPSSTSVSLDQDQPPGLKPAVIRSVSGRLEQGFNNLLGGSLDAE